MRVVVTNEVMLAVQSRAIFPFKQTATLRPDGQWLLNLDDDSYDRLTRIQQPGETLSDVIVRLCATAGRYQQ